MPANGQLHAPVALHPGKEPPVPTGYEVEWASESSGRDGEEKESHPRICRDSNPRQL